MKRGEWIMKTLVLLSLTASAAGQKKWDGEGLDSLWSNERNWFPDGVPLPGDDVVIDNEWLPGGYKIKLPTGMVGTNILSLSILPGPGNSIVVELPSSNIASPGLTIASTVNALRIGKSGTFINSSGASSGNSIVLNGGLSIENGGRYVHRTQRGNATIVSKLQLEPSTYQGIFEFDVPGNAGYTLSVSGKQFGNLVLSSSSSGKKSYTGSGTSVLHVYGDLEIGDSSSFTASLNNNIRIGSNLVVKGKLSLNPSLTDSVNRDLDFYGDSSSLAITGNWTMGDNFNQVLVSRGCLALKSNASLNNAHTTLKIAPAAVMMFGVYSIAGSGSIVSDSASTLGFGAVEGIATDSSIGNIRLEKLSIHPKTNHVFYGEESQQTGGRFPALAASLSVNKPSGQLSLTKALQVTDSIRLVQGNLLTDNNRFLTFSGSKIQASSNGFVAGPFRYWTSTQQDLHFPVGKAIQFAPFIISRKNSDTALFQAEYHAMGYLFPDSAISFPVRSVSNSEYWTIKKIFPADSLPSNDIIHFSMGSNSTSNIIGQPLLVRMASGAAKWELLPLYANNTIPTAVASAPSILRSGIYTFGSMFPSALPNERLAICQQERNGFTRLSWTTDMDETVALYVIEKSSGNGTYLALDSVTSKKRAGKTSYSIDLRSSSISGNFIRLRSEDHKGRSVYSNVLYIKPSNEILRLFPNPSNNMIRIEPIAEPNRTIEIMSQMGQVIQARSRMREQQLGVDIKHLPAGKYFLILNVAGKKRMFPFVKQ